MEFLFDSAARVHPRVWEAMRAADTPDLPYDNDVLSKRLDAAFSELFGRQCSVLWASTGTAANCLALTPLVEPHGGVICHREAHIERDECGAAGFYLHGAKLLLADGEGARLRPEAIDAVISGMGSTVHQAQAHAISISQVSEYGLAYTPLELQRIGALAKEHGLGLHMDGARFANAVAHLGCSPADAAGPVDALSFGCTKNGTMNADAIIFFDPEKADLARWRRKRAGHLQSKGRFLAAQLLALVVDGLWLDNARAANRAAALVAAEVGERLAYPAQSNEIFIWLDAIERATLRGRGMDFYEWDDEKVRIVASWDTRPEDAVALGKAIAAL